MEDFSHHPAMADEVLECLAIKAEGVYVDATTGLGGHSELILGELGPGGRLICMDRDERALEMARGRLNDTRCTFIHGRFSDMGGDVTGSQKVDGVFFDFGVSMMQLRDHERGFSFDSDDVLDMRMDRDDEITAEDIVNTWGEKDLANVIFNYGQEGRSRKIAAAIVNARGRGRDRARIRTCRELADIVVRAMGGRRGRTHPATRTFQALRMAVNDELGQIRLGLQGAVDLAAPGARIVTLSYHSLEDREVKLFFRQEAHEGRATVITKKPLTPARDEMRQHPSARSARLRCMEVIKNNG